VRIKAKRAGTEQERKEREMLYCNSTQLAPLSCTFSLYVLSTDLGAARCLNDLQCAELSKETVAKKKSEGKNNAHEQRHEPLVTHAVLYLR